MGPTQGPQFVRVPTVNQCIYCWALNSKHNFIKLFIARIQTTKAMKRFIHWNAVKYEGIADMDFLIFNPLCRIQTHDFP